MKLQKEILINMTDLVNSSKQVQNILPIPNLKNKDKLLTK